MHAHTCTHTHILGFVFWVFFFFLTGEEEQVCPRKKFIKLGVKLRTETPIKYSPTLKKIKSY